MIYVIYVACLKTTTKMYKLVSGEKGTTTTTTIKDNEKYKAINKYVQKCKTKSCF